MESLKYKQEIMFASWAQTNIQSSRQAHTRSTPSQSHISADKSAAGEEALGKKKAEMTTGRRLFSAALLWVLLLFGILVFFLVQTPSPLSFNCITQFLQSSLLSELFLGIVLRFDFRPDSAATELWTSRMLSKASSVRWGFDSLTGQFSWGTNGAAYVCWVLLCFGRKAIWSK